MLGGAGVFDGVQGGASGLSGDVGWCRRFERGAPGAGVLGEGAGCCKAF